MFELQASAKEVKLNLVFKNQLPYKVTGDERRLKQVIVNLLSNAMKFTPLNGSITILAEFKPQSK